MAEKCLMVCADNVMEVFHGMLAPTQEARDTAIEEIELAMLDREADSNGGRKLFCTVGNCAVSCNLTIKGVKFDEWSDESCTQEDSRPPLKFIRTDAQP